MSLSSTPVCTALLGLAITCVASTTHARTTDGQQEAVINGGHYVVDAETGADRFSKGFDLTQGSREITSNEAVIHRGDEGLSRILLTGQPATWKETLDDGSRIDIKASTIDYDLATELVVLTGDVRVQKGIQVITGQSVRFNVRTQQLEAGSREGDSPIRMVIKPVSKPSPEPDADTPSENETESN